jgi:hypothetical protein
MQFRRNPPAIQRETDRTAEQCGSRLPIFGLFRMLNEFPTQCGQICLPGSVADRPPIHGQPASNPMRITPLALLLVAALAAGPARADLHITRDHGGYVEEYKVRYERIRDRGERVIIDGICNSACTLVLGIVPMNKICVTPRASLGFHQAYYDKAFTFGIKVTSSEGTSELMSYYPDTVKQWIRHNGGLTTEMKKIKNGEELWKIVDPCPDEW